MIYTYDKLGKNGRFGNQLFQIASTIGMAQSFSCGYAFPEWEYQKHFINQLPIVNGSPVHVLNGYLQDYKLFRHCEQKIRDQFVMVDDFLKVDLSDFVFIHFRAYSDEGVTHYHPEQTKEYYAEAMKQFPDKEFIVFTDNIEKARTRFPADTMIHKGSEMEDFYAMTQCGGGIISNSTFAWWAAWLMNKKTVIPSNWFTNKAPYDASGLYIPNWIVI